MIRVAIVNMDRFYTDAATGIFVDTATHAAGGTLTLGLRLRRTRRVRRCCRPAPRGARSTRS